MNSHFITEELIDDLKGMYPLDVWEEIGKSIVQDLKNCLENGVNE
jgi:hypothetical protein